MGSYSFRRAPSPLPGTWLLPCLVLLASCGLPKPFDLRAEMSNAIQNLGISAFYPLREGPRIGNIYLVDRSTAEPGVHLSPTDETNILLTEALTPAFEQARRTRAAMRAGGRFRQSDVGIANALQPANNGVAYYRQTIPAVSSLAVTNSAGVAAPADAARHAVRPAASPTPAPAPEEQNLALAAFPGFTLASVDQASLAANIPIQLASFLGGLGLRHTSYLKIEAEGTEYADLPFDTTLDLIRTACSRDDPPLGDAGTGPNAIALVKTAVFKMERDWDKRADQARRENWVQPPAFNPQLGIVIRIYYLRGIRFIIDDSRATAAILQASFANRLPAGVSAPSLPAITINNAAPTTAAGGTPPRTAASDAQVDAMLQSIQSLRNAISSSTQAGIAATAARATARGVELVDVFDRPLAFGYAAIWAAIQPDSKAQVDQLKRGGLTGVCAFSPAAR